jgi:hypothetical protein
MTQDEMIEMARQAELNLYVHDLTEKQYIEVIKHFAKLVAAKEREACAKIVQMHLDGSDDLTTKGSLVSVLDYFRAKARGESWLSY